MKRARYTSICMILQRLQTKVANGLMGVKWPKEVHVYWAEDPSGPGSPLDPMLLVSDSHCLLFSRFWSPV